MKWSWKVARVGGIDIRVHATFLLLLAWWAAMYYGESGPAAALRGTIFTLALFASVVTHELGHALTARRFGVATRNITLLPIGGVASLEEIPDKPKQELAIALAGPIVTALIALALNVGLRVAHQPTALQEDAIAKGGAAKFIAQLMWVNVSLLVFNMLPAFPMDGGRVLRAALALRGDYLHATEVAAKFGRGFAALFAVAGLFYSPFLLLIAVFVWAGATAESAATIEHAILRDVAVHALTMRSMRTLAPNDRVDSALETDLAGIQRDFPVAQDDRLVGMVTRAALIAALSRNGPQTTVGQCMDTTFPVANPSDRADAIAARLRQTRRQALPVVENGRLLGLVTSEGLAEYVLVAAARRAAARKQAPRGASASIQANP